ncbi:MAG: hypothetical protein K0U52_10855 [Gammaproteobacteria bacterium]|nr:hypothetical protein [Gammaproteobacteria bacterium]
MVDYPFVSLDNQRHYTLETLGKILFLVLATAASLLVIVQFCFVVMHWHQFEQSLDQMKAMSTCVQCFINVMDAPSQLSTCKSICVH